MKKVVLPIEELARRYAEGETPKTIGRSLGASEGTVRRRLIEAGIVPRREKEMPIEEAVELYEAGMNAGDIGGRYGVSPQTVIRRLKRAGVTIRTSKDWAKGSPPFPMDEDRLRELAARGMSTREMAPELGCSEECVRQRMIRLGIARLPAKARMERNHFWNGGRTVDRHGYVLVKVPGHPRANRAGYVREHRLVMEATLGRYLEPGEVVHHKDDDPGNNAPENLVLYRKNADHLRETLAGKRPNWTEEGLARMRSPRPRRVPATASSPGETGNDGPASPSPADRPPS